LGVNGTVLAQNITERQELMVRRFFEQDFFCIFQNGFLVKNFTLEIFLGSGKFKQPQLKMKLECGF
jgi:hypothetical protein